MYNEQYFEEEENSSVPTEPSVGYNYVAWPQQVALSVNVSLPVLWVQTGSIEQASYLTAGQEPGPSFPVYPQAPTSTTHGGPPGVYEPFAQYSATFATGQAIPISPQAHGNYYLPAGSAYLPQASTWSGSQIITPSQAQAYLKEEGSDGGSAQSYRSSSEEGTLDSKGKAVSTSPTNQFFAHAPPENWQTRGDSTILHMYRPGTASASPKNTSALVAVFKQDPEGSAKLRTPNTACYHCKHRRIKCEDKIYTKAGRPFCSACVQRQGPCYWPPRYHPYLQADYLTVRRSELMQEDPQRYAALVSQGKLDDQLLGEFDASKCPKPISWTWRYNEHTGRKEFDNVPPTGKEKTPKRRKTLDDYWWDRW
ncbi:hypothetical protein DACRYDRAFT_99096 [Dacryopinax primogenitus]|uniref:Zn(2)-C6 fungal-type domain-containing protein n=1 Tax=Dacryopinax primogenitus (strain DJM 731) TaxID=1858805 RepID=M5GFX2_DACPD|nr:uncharacterized protein DACRYDRAFT_99096 [Dacryopinax primogenitus]EJU04523.1 hypothetical protein DACRYDRAFT_99096 [Dacryopinax primogenitus]